MRQAENSERRGLSIKRQTWRRYVLRLMAVLVLSATAVHAQMTWVGTWAAAITPFQPPLSPALPTSYSNVTFRNVVRISAGGRQMRIILSNEFGLVPLDLGGVHVALSGDGGGIVSGSDHSVKFGDSETVRIPAGAVAVSDPIAWSLPAFADLAVSLYIPADETADHLSFHALASSTNYVADGNQVASASLSNARTMPCWSVLKGVDVLTGERASAVVVLGDSITDGAYSTANKNRRWTDFLAERFQMSPKTQGIGVLNAGISGNRMLTYANPAVGQDALARFDRDVLGQTGVGYVIVLEGTNDLGRIAKPTTPYDKINSAALIWSLQQMAARAHAHGLKIFPGTILPYGGSFYYSAEGEQMRQAVNEFIRTSKVFDGFIDFDKALRDATDITKYKAMYDSGDHLHPNDAGYGAMGTVVPLSLFH